MLEIRFRIVRTSPVQRSVKSKYFFFTYKTALGLNLSTVVVIKKMRNLLI